MNKLLCGAMNNALCEILSMCRLISRESDADVFFDYAPHCNAYSVYWYRDGWTQETAGDMVWLNCTTKITCKNMNDTLAKLNAIATEMGVV